MIDRVFAIKKKEFTHNQLRNFRTLYHKIQLDGTRQKIP